MALSKPTAGYTGPSPRRASAKSVPTRQSAVKRRRTRKSGETHAAAGMADAPAVTRKRISSRDVARVAGVSQSAVSRAFSPGRSVSEKTRRKVLRAAEGLGYQINAFARSLITQRSRLIGVVMGDITNPFYPEVLRLFTQRLQTLGQRVLLFTVGHGHDVDEALPALLQYQIDGVIITSAFLSSQMADVYARRKTPVILFNRSIRNDHVICVTTDNVAGGELVANLVAEAGHRRPAFVAGLENTSTSEDRERGFMERLRQSGHVDVPREVGDYTYEGGHDACVRLLTRTKRPDAIFCANDIMALGALDAARRTLGLRVPDDVSIIGFDDIPAASWKNYALTTVRQRRQRMVDVAIDALFARIEDQRVPFGIRLVPGELVVRETARLPLQQSNRERARNKRTSR